MMTERDRQHWVPQFYLRAFASDQNDQVWAFAREGESDPFRVGVKNIAAQNGLFPATTDARLREIEDLVGRVWGQVAHGYVDLQWEALRKALSLFVATLYLRNPARLADVSAVHENLVAFFDTGPKDDKGRPFVDLIEIRGVEYEFDARGWDEYRNWGEHDFRRSLASVVEGSAGSIAQILLGKRWAIVVDEGGGFATSDAPVSFRHPSCERYGFRTPGTVVSVPLSPTRFVIIDDHAGESGYFYSKPGFVDAMNYKTWSHTYRFLISKAPPDVILAGVMAFADAHGIQ